MISMEKLNYYGSLNMIMQILLLIGSSVNAQEADMQSRLVKCPQNCTCAYVEGRYTTDCGGAGYHSIPSIEPKTMRLIMDRNPLRLITQKDFRESELQNLKELSLTDCQIEKLPASAFRGLANLNRLRLSKNRIQNLITGTFDGLSTLEHLDLSFNLIENIEVDTFRGAYNLKHIDLSNNRIRFIYSGAFNGLPNLRNILLQENLLSRLFKEPFERLPALGLIVLIDNPWSCDCNLRPFVAWARSRHFMVNPPKCDSPANYDGKTWNMLHLEDFACTPRMEPAVAPPPVRVELGETTSFICKTQGDPIPTLRWEFRSKEQRKSLHNEPDHYEIETTTDIKSHDSRLSTLKVLEIDDSKFGQYHCIAQNPIGSEHLVFTLQWRNETSSDLSISDMGQSFAQVAQTRWFLIIIAVAIAAIVLICLIAIIAWFRRKRQKKRPMIYTHMNGNGYKCIASDGPNPLEKPPRVYVSDPNDGGFSSNVHVAALEKQRQLQTKTLEVTFVAPDHYLPNLEYSSKDDSGYVGGEHSPRYATLPARSSKNPSPQFVCDSQSSSIDYRRNSISGNNNNNNSFTANKTQFAGTDQEDTMTRMPLRETAL